MTEVTYNNRRAVRLENDHLRVTVLVGGGHIAEIFHKKAGVNPLWTPPWPSIEPSHFNPATDTGYGADAESKLLSGIMGHNLCLDIFGGPSEDEAAAGITVHGEGSVLDYEIRPDGDGLQCTVLLHAPMLLFQRHIHLDGETVRISETVNNMTACDRALAWTQHVTLGPPFIEPGLTEFRTNATLSKTFESDFTDGKGYMAIGEEFVWPHVPHKDGGAVDLRVFPAYEVSGGYTAHLMDPESEDSHFLAWSPTSKLLFGYRWKRSDFPWLGIWEENRCRTSAPWNGVTITRGMEFGVSPFPETHRAMIDRGTLFGERTYRWIPARSSASVDYTIVARMSDTVPDSL
ncbi:MAG: hypothetical protein ABI693_06125 [Bryobacteraceae bacterium]